MCLITVKYDYMGGGGFVSNPIDAVLDSSDRVSLRSPVGGSKCQGRVSKCRTVERLSNQKTPIEVQRTFQLYYYY
jgi:hypothetical protein